MNSVSSHASAPVAAPGAHGWGMLLMLGSLIAFAPLSIDMYLPGLPEIAREFAVSGGVAQYTLAAYFVGMAIGQLLYGPLADRFGRKPPLYFGMALYTVASLACVVAPNVEALIAWRFAQALGGCAGVVVPLAMVADRFDQQGSARALSRLMLVMGVAPILAPVLGSFVVAHWSWRAIFGLLAAGGFLALLAARFLLAESLPSDARHVAGVRAALGRYGALLVQRDFLGYALIGGFASAGMFAYIAGSSFVFIDLFGLSPQQYGAVFGANALGLIMASQVNHALLGQWRSAQLLKAALMAMAVLGLAAVGMALGLPVKPEGVWPLLGVLLPIFGFLVTFGAASPNTSATAMSLQRSGGGSASAALGTLQFGFGAVAGAVVGALNDGSAVPMTSVMAVCGLGALASWRYIVTPSARR
jgi:DHA1 family bicyclomycin/chloramphenicol resistance-like MFS transporter